MRTRYLYFIFVPWLFLTWNSHGIMFSNNNTTLRLNSSSSENRYLFISSDPSSSPSIHAPP